MEANTSRFNTFVREHLYRSGRPVPSRVETALALLERLREFPSTNLRDHARPNLSQLVDHERFGAAAHSHWNLASVSETYGRKSNQLAVWGQALLDLIGSIGLATNEPQRTASLRSWQSVLVESIQSLLADEPLKIRTSSRTAESVIRDVLCLAAQKNMASAVAQAIVGTKLMLRFPERRADISVAPANQPDRLSADASRNRRGDFDLGDHVFEVCVGPPDPKHINQARSIVSSSASEVWLLVLDDTAASWKNARQAAGISADRCVVASIDAFVGQNVTELGDLSAHTQRQRLDELFTIYNEVWVPVLGRAGLRIEVTG